MQLEKLSTSDVNFLKNVLISCRKRSLRLFVKSLKFILPIVLIILFIPAHYLKWLGVFQKGRKNVLRTELEESTFSRFSYFENLLFVLIPILISFAFIYYFFFVKIKKPIQKDLIEKNKEVIKIPVTRVSEISERMKLDLPSNIYADHYLRLELNEFKIRERYFSKALEPDLMKAQFIVYERAQNSKIEIKNYIL